MIWALVFGAVVLVVVLLFFGQSSRPYEDTHSRSVMIRRQIGPFTLSERLLYTTPGFVSAKAVWTDEVQHHFDDRIRADSWLVVRNSVQTNIFHVRIVARSGVEFTHYDSSGERISNGRTPELQFGSARGSFPLWSWTELGEGVVYADDVFLRPLPQMYAVALIRSATNGITEVTNRLATLKFGKLPYEPIGN